MAWATNLTDEQRRHVVAYLDRILTQGLQLPKAFEILKLRRQKTKPEKLRAIGKARRIAEASVRSGWDRYIGIKERPGAIAAARADNVNRLVDCLRSRKPMTDEDREELKGYIATKFRRRLWPPELHHALTRTPITEYDFDLLADLVEKLGRGRGGKHDDAAHRVAREVRVLASIIAPGRCSTNLRDKLIDLALAHEEDETGLTLDDDGRWQFERRVRNILDHPAMRDRTEGTILPRIRVDVAQLTAINLVPKTRRTKLSAG